MRWAHTNTERLLSESMADGANDLHPDALVASDWRKEVFES